MFDVELKAKCPNLKKIRGILHKEGATSSGIEKQIDIYFKTKNGRLKLRRGSKKSLLIYYQRPDIEGIKPNEYQLYEVGNPEQLEKMLTAALEVRVIVKKEREVFSLQNIKFNLDKVEELGDFIEIEAMAKTSEEIGKLEGVVKDFATLLGIREGEMQSQSYSDLLLEVHKKS